MYMDYIHIIKYYLALKNKILRYSTIWMKFEYVMLNEINQSQKKIYTACFYLYKVSKLVRVTVTMSRMVVVRGWGER